MIKYYCDCCGKEQDSCNINSFKHLCHIGSNSINAYVDADGNRTSGRDVSKQLCNRCYNIVLVAAMDKFNEIKQVEDK